MACAMCWVAATGEPPDAHDCICLASPDPAPDHPAGRQHLHLFLTATRARRSGRSRDGERARPCRDRPYPPRVGTGSATAGPVRPLRCGRGPGRLRPQLLRQSRSVRSGARAFPGDARIDAVRNARRLYAWRHVRCRFCRVAQLTGGPAVARARPLWHLERFPATLELTLCAMLVGCMLGVTLGVASAVWRNSPADLLSRALALFGI